MVDLISTYQNGNYQVKIFSDGTKIRETEEDIFIPAFAENCDVKITDRCDGDCAYCYEGCTSGGAHGDILNYKFLDTLHPYTEMAINGNDLSHPDLIPFLERLKEKKVIANMTVSQIHFEREFDFIKTLIDNNLIKGLGVSLKYPTEDFINKIKSIPNAVIHTIVGVTTMEDYQALAHHDLKILILGYKKLRRGAEYYIDKMWKVDVHLQKLYDNLEELLKWFKVVSFDNLAIEQLWVKRLVPEEDWEEFYMGDDGKFTFYIDMVEGKFGKNSLATERFEILDSIDEMFEKIVEG